jgi:hypothetical protein
MTGTAASGDGRLLEPARARRWRCDDGDACTQRATRCNKEPARRRAPLLTPWYIDADVIATIHKRRGRLPCARRHHRDRRCLGDAIHPCPWRVCDSATKRLRRVFGNRMSGWHAYSGLVSACVALDTAGRCRGRQWHGPATTGFGDRNIASARWTSSVVEADPRASGARP